MEMNITFPGGSRVDAHYKDFVIRTDQPVRLGGDGSAPAPFDHFLASIGTCAGFYVLKFLESRDLSPADVRLSLVTTKNRETHLIDQIEIRIRVPHDFPRKYERALEHAIDLCAVKKHILEAPRFRTVIETETPTAASVA